MDCYLLFSIYAMPLCDRCIFCSSHSLASSNVQKHVHNFESLCVDDDNCVVVGFYFCCPYLPFSKVHHDAKCVLVNGNV